MDFTYQLNDSAITVNVEGDVLYGGDEVLLDRDDDLTANADWAAQGYTVTPFLPAEHAAALRDGIRNLIRRILGMGEDFRLEDYHKLGGSDPAVHAALVDGIRKGFSLELLPIPYRLIEERVSEVVGVKVIARNRAYGLDVFNLRVVRPGANDNNPLHRDVWLDRLRNGINIYAPLAGSTERSSLCLVPGSHRWSEADIARTAAGAKVNGLPYTVPAVVGAKKPLALIRPNPGEDEVLLFSPYLIHGGAVNLNPDTTRASLEMRFWRA